jgi:hypothetical protein
MRSPTAAAFRDGVLGESSETAAAAFASSTTDPDDWHLQRITEEALLAADRGR